MTALMTGKTMKDFTNSNGMDTPVLFKKRHYTTRGRTVLVTHLGTKNGESKFYQKANNSDREV